MRETDEFIILLVYIPTVKVYTYVLYTFMAYAYRIKYDFIELQRAIKYTQYCMNYLKNTCGSIMYVHLYSEKNYDYLPDGLRT